MFYVLSILIQLQEERKKIGLSVTVLALYISLLFFTPPPHKLGNQNQIVLIGSSENTTAPHQP